MNLQELKENEAAIKEFQQQRIKWMFFHARLSIISTAIVLIVLMLQLFLK